MKYGVYGIRDRLTGFVGINLDVNDDTAVRGFTMAVNQDNPGVLGFRPSDFELCKLAEFDSNTGKIVPLELIDMLCRGDSVAWDTPTKGAPDKDRKENE